MENNKASKKWNKWIIIITIVVAGLIVWCVNGGQLMTVPLTDEYMSEENPIMRKELIEKCNTVTGSVERFELVAGHLDVYLNMGRDFSFVRVRVYLNNNEAKLLHRGDMITVRGSIHYSNITSYGVNIETITVGESFGFPLIGFKAKLLSID